MNSRERVALALNHQKTDKVPVDISGTINSGIHAFALARLIEALGLEKRIVKVFEPMTMQGQVDYDVINALGCDVIGLHSPFTFPGYKNENWKIWELHGNQVLIGGGFNCSYGDDGTIYLYPQGDTSVPPSAKMPSTGYFFDNIYRQEDLKNHTHDARSDFFNQFTIFSEEECDYYEKTSKKLYDETDYAIFGNFFQGGIGDVFFMPGAWLKTTRGIRDISLWYMAHFDHPGYIQELFAMQMEYAMKNLELYKQCVGERISAIGISGTDFGTQNGPMISLELYRKLYKPHHKNINDWIHKNTKWKTLLHSCGSIFTFLDDFVEAGFDIINPVQFNAAKMDPEVLKSKYGEKLVFWGGGANSQSTLPFGSPSEIEQEVKKNVEILSRGGGYICGTVHNIQAPTPPENIIAFFNAVNN